MTCRRSSSRWSRAGLPEIIAPSGTSPQTPDLSGDGHARADRDVTARADLARDLDVVADDGRAGKAGQRRDRAVLADPAVVTDLHEIIDLRAACRSTCCRSARGRCSVVRADFDVVVELDVADLRNRSRRPSRNAQPKPSLPITRPRAARRDRRRTQRSVDDRARMQPSTDSPTCTSRRRRRRQRSRSRADPRARADVGVRPTYASAPISRARIDDGAVGWTERPARHAAARARPADRPARAAAFSTTSSGLRAAPSSSERRIDQHGRRLRQPARQRSSVRRSRTSARPHRLRRPRVTRSIADRPSPTTRPPTRAGELRERAEHGSLRLGRGRGLLGDVHSFLDVGRDVDAAVADALAA